MKYGDEFKKGLKDEEYKKKEKGNLQVGSNNPDKKEYKKEMRMGDKTAHQKKTMAGKMDKYGVNMEKMTCSECGKQGHKAKDCSY